MLNSRLARYGLYALLALAAFAAGVWMRHGDPNPQPNAAEALYALRLPDLAAQPQQLAQWRGKVLVVNFWATWCAPCREEIPELVKLQAKYGGQGLQIVGISIDQADKTGEFAANFKINYPVLVAGFDVIELSRQAGNDKRVLPFTVVLQRQGEIAATELGGVNLDKLEKLVKPLL